MGLYFRLIFYTLKSVELLSKSVIALCNVQFVKLESIASCLKIKIKWPISYYFLVTFYIHLTWNLGKNITFLYLMFKLLKFRSYLRQITTSFVGKKLSLWAFRLSPSCSTLWRCRATSSSSSTSTTTTTPSARPSSRPTSSSSGTEWMQSVWLGKCQHGKCYLMIQIFLLFYIDQAWTI